MSANAAPPRGPVGIRDVAALAEVSTGTVSNTINHPERVHPRTRSAVEHASHRISAAGMAGRSSANTPPASRSIPRPISPP